MSVCRVASYLLGVVLAFAGIGFVDVLLTLALSAGGDHGRLMLAVWLAYLGVGLVFGFVYRELARRVWFRWARRLEGRRVRLVRLGVRSPVARARLARLGKVVSLPREP